MTRLWPPLALALLCALLAPAARANQYLILRTTVNGVDYGDRTYTAGDDGDYFAKASDLQEYGVELSALVGLVKDFGGSRWVSLRSLAPACWSKVSYEEQSIRIEIAPSLLRKVTVALAPQVERKGPLQTEAGSTFINYALGGRCIDAGWQCEASANAEAGVTVADSLLFSDVSYRTSNRWPVRGLTHLVHDFPERRTRLIVGDAPVMPTLLGSSGTIGGIGYGTDDRVDPYFVRNPFYAFSGQTVAPAQIEVYQNASLIQRQAVPAGNFDVTNYRPMMGQSDLTVIVRDAYDRVYVLNRSIFLLPTILRRGLTEGGAFFGLARLDQGTSSFSYGGPTLSGYYRRGVFDWLTLGVSSESSFDLFRDGKTHDGYLAAAEAAVLIFDTAAVSSNVAWSLGPQGPSGAFGLAADYARRPFSIDANLTYFDSAYAQVFGSTPFEKRRLMANLTSGLSLRRAGSFSVGLQAATFYSARATAGARGMYTYGLPWNLTLLFTTSATQRFDAGRSDGAPLLEVMVTLIRGFDAGFSASTTGAVSDERGLSGRVNVQRNAPADEGVGGVAEVEGSLDRRASDPEQRLGGRVFLNASYRGRFGIVSADVTRNEEGAMIYNASGGGALLWVGRSVQATRPVSDAFGLIKVGDLEGVRVYHWNREIGRTDKYGTVLAPNLLSYQNNKISIEPRDVPLDYQLSEIDTYLVPRHRSGVSFDFGTARFTAITGRLVLLRSGQRTPLPLGFVSVPVGDGAQTSPTGNDGEFYLEKLAAGSYNAHYQGSQGAFRCQLVVPEPAGLFTDVGEVTCE